jgi:arsenate reductase (thioredoxin)
MERVIFACMHNAGRSQMAAAFLSDMAEPTHVESVSAGTQPADGVHPAVVEVMREVGIDLSGKRPQRLTPELAQGASLLVTMGCGDDCPYVPGLQRDDWPLRDPKDLPISEVRAVRDEIRDRVASLIDARGWRRRSSSAQRTELPVACTLSPAALEVRRENLLNALLRRTSERHELPNGYRLRFAADGDVLGQIARAIDAERHCCRFLQFAITVQPDAGPITLDLTGPAGTREFLSALFDLP